MSGESSGIRVLHVDDEPEFGELVALHLGQVDDDITVLTESDPYAALDRLEDASVDCVVSDHDMPGMDGLELLKTVRERAPELPFVLFTGKGSEEIASDAISAGVTEYVQKQVGSDQYAVLANRIKRAVEANRAKEALEESERQLSTLISNIPGMVYRARNEPGWPMEFVSEGVKDLSGYTADQLESGAVAWGSLIPSDATDRLWTAVQNSLSAGEPFEVTYPIETSDGERRWMWERGRKVGETADGVAVLEGFITDISERIERDRQLEREQEFTENLINAIDDAFVLLDSDGELLRWNETLAEMAGYSDDELAGVNAQDLFENEAQDSLEEVRQQIVETGGGKLEAPLVTSDGSRIQVEFRGTRIERQGGEVFGIVGIGRDITERKQREQKLEEYETLVENVGDPMYVLDTDGVIQVTNDAMADHLGYDEPEIVGSHSTEFMPAEDLEKGTETLGRLAEEGSETWARFEMRTIDAEGEVTLNETKIALLYDEADTVVGSVGVVRDITARKEREQELERYETIVEALGDPVYALDAEGRFTYINEAISQMTGYTPEELVGESIALIMTTEDVEAGESVIRELLEDGVDHATLEMDVVTRSGDRVPCENNMALLPQPDGEFTGSAGVIRDIAERKERERRLSEFASVVSHDLRSPLNVVQGRIDLARETGDVSHLDAAATGAERMEELIGDLLTLAKKGEMVSETVPVDLAGAVESSWGNVDAPDATLECTSTAMIDADADRLREVFENLFRNSVEHGSTDSRSETDDSVEHGGPGVTITVGTLEGDSGETTGFYVADDGPGVPEAERETVFERGHTTSPDGTGFGLAIVEDIVDAHGWDIELTASDSGGARFEIRTARAGE